MISVGPYYIYAYGKIRVRICKQTGVRLIVGKGGMGSETARACKDFGALHCVFPAGNAVLAARSRRNRICELA